MQAHCSRKSAISIIAERTLHLFIKARVASHTMLTESWLLDTSPWYLGNNTSSGWCFNYTLYEREKFSPGTYWLHYVCAKQCWKMSWGDNARCKVIQNVITSLCILFILTVSYNLWAFSSHLSPKNVGDLCYRWYIALRSSPPPPKKKSESSLL